MHSATRRDGQKREKTTYEGLGPDERPDGRRDAVGHELEVAVGRDERDRAVALELGQPHALMELDVLELDRLAAGSYAGRGAPAARSACGAIVATGRARDRQTFSGGVEHHFVVQAQTEFGHAGQVALHLHGT